MANPKQIIAEIYDQIKKRCPINLTVPTMIRYRGAVRFYNAYTRRPRDILMGIYEGLIFSSKFNFESKSAIRIEVGHLHHFVRSRRSKSVVNSP